MQVTRTTMAGWLVAVATGATVATALAVPASATDGQAVAPQRAATSTANATSRTAAGVKTYWTAARLRSATPVNAIPAPARTAELQASGKAGTTAAANVAAATALPVAASTTVGRVFFYNPVGTVNVSAGNHSCSASALNSGSKQLVVTAGHCVHGGAGGAYYENWIFIPAYNSGSEPYGRFEAKQYRTFNSWTGSSDFARDVSMVTTWPNANGAVVNVVGGNGLAWNYPKSLPITILAYPADPPYTGANQQYCSGTTTDFGSTIGLRCGFTGGSSGGPWLKDYNDSTGFVNGAMSTLSGDGTNAASYFDTAVKTMLDDQGDVT